MKHEITVEGNSQSALAGIRVLDLSSRYGHYAGKLFADLGADVLLIEPTAGCAMRREGPFLDQRPHAEGSLSFAYFNSGKRSVGLDLATPEGRQIFLKLAAGVDLILETGRPGELAALGLGYEELRAVRQGIVVTSITPFGQAGPYAQYECEDIVALALGGLLYLGGYPDGAPMAAAGQQAWRAGEQFAAIASMMAIYRAEDSGQGCAVDVSIQECVVLALENAVQFFDLEGSIRKRYGGTQKQAGTGVFPCADGMVYLMAGGVASNRFWYSTVQWLIDEGVSQAEALKDDKWLDTRFLETDEARQIFLNLVIPFLASRTKAYLYTEGQRRRIPICPVSTTADLVENRQLAHRQYFVDVPHPHSGRSLRAPGAPYGLSKTPWRIQRPAPRLGEHTFEVLSELGYGHDDQQVLLAAEVIA
jgi:benzylsuccinate CoA-transferase BbsE subunit